MSKYICQICGYVYDEETEKIKFDDLPEDWVCPLCGASKDMFEKSNEELDKSTNQSKPVKQNLMHEKTDSDDLREMTEGELAAIFSNLAKGCEKQYKSEEAKLYSRLAEYYTSKVKANEQAQLSVLREKIKSELTTEFAAAKKDVENAADRGAKRVLVWSEKVTKIIESILMRYEKEGNAMLADTKIWVCDICGFVFIGETPPSVCPICKVPSFKITEVARV